MLQTKNRNFKRLGTLALLGFLASTGISLMNPAPAEAASSPTVTATFMDPVGTTSLRPGEHAGDAGNFYVPVKIDMRNTSSLSVSINAATADLVGTISSTNKITSVPSDGEYAISQMSNQWGYRWNLGDQIKDMPSSGSGPKNYQQMPTKATLLDTIPTPGSRDTTVTKYLTLGFGVGVNGETPADTYTNEITVSVVATPLGATTIFDITYMQEMTTDICHNTQTPDAMAISTGVNINVGPDGTSYTNFIDTDGSKQSLGADATKYVPQATLIDKRDGKKYTIRKFADGNCWMVSNLEFDLVPTADKDIVNGTTSEAAFSTTGEDTLSGEQITLTNTDTDLNSVTTWTPAIAVELYGAAGTVYKTQRNSTPGNNNGSSASAPSATPGTVWAPDGVDGLRNFSSAAGYPNKLYSTKTYVRPEFDTANTGEPWQKFGNLYNWTAATLGSGTKVAMDGENAKDSICPRGWKLPYNSGNDSFSKLITSTYDITSSSAGANQLANFPLNFLRTGNYSYSNALIVNRTVIGYWWSATRSSATDANYMNADTSSISTRSSGNRSLGFAIRCVAR